eukprot:2924243-Heterocapsa_arctica.AAC.1
MLTSSPASAADVLAADVLARRRRPRDVTLDQGLACGALARAVGVGVHRWLVLARRRRHRDVTLEQRLACGALARAVGAGVHRRLDAHDD